MTQHPENKPSLPTDRAFVLQFHADADVGQGHFEGRIEHVVSGQATRFQSPDELLAFIGRVMTDRE